MNVRCPHCETLYRVDPARVPAGGVRARCAECGDAFPVGRTAPARPRPVAPNGSAASPPPGAPAPPPADRSAAAPTPPPTPPAAERSAAEPAPERPAAEAAAPAQAPSATAPVSPFGPQDPQVRAQRLARALVSDIVMYHPEKRERCLSDGTLRTEFREEVLKSWEEYVTQVGQEMARGTDYFRDALNEILAKGKQVF